MLMFAFKFEVRTKKVFL